MTNITLNASADIKSNICYITGFIKRFSVKLTFDQAQHMLQTMCQFGLGCNSDNLFYDYVIPAVKALAKPAYENSDVPPILTDENNVLRQDTEWVFITKFLWEYYSDDQKTQVKSFIAQLPPEVQQQILYRISRHGSEQWKKDCKTLFGELIPELVATGNYEYYAVELYTLGAAAGLTNDDMDCLYQDAYVRLQTPENPPIKAIKIMIDFAKADDIDLIFDALIKLIPILQNDSFGETHCFRKDFSNYIKSYCQNITQEQKTQLTENIIHTITKSKRLNESFSQFIIAAFAIITIKNQQMIKAALVEHIGNKLLDSSLIAALWPLLSESEKLMLRENFFRDEFSEYLGEDTLASIQSILPLLDHPEKAYFAQRLSEVFLYQDTPQEAYYQLIYPLRHFFPRKDSERYKELKQHVVSLQHGNQTNGIWQFFTSGQRSLSPSSELTVTQEHITRAMLTGELRAFINLRSSDPSPTRWSFSTPDTSRQQDIAYAQQMLQIVDGEANIETLSDRPEAHQGMLNMIRDHLQTWHDNNQASQQRASAGAPESKSG